MQVNWQEVEKRYENCMLRIFKCLSCHFRYANTSSSILSNFVTKHSSSFMNLQKNILYIFNYISLRVIISHYYENFTNKTEIYCQFSITKSSFRLNLLTWMEMVYGGNTLISVITRWRNCLGTFVLYNEPTNPKLIDKLLCVPTCFNNIVSSSASS